MTHAPHHDAQWLDLMYNNRARVPEHGRHFERWARDSAAFRARQPDGVDLAYGAGAGETLDVFRPAEPDCEPAPVLVFIHGGYWRALDKSDHSFIAEAFTAEGAVVVVPNYALCPAVTIPHITLQMAHALAWTWHHIGEWGGDRRRITVAGHSAGGQLAAMMMTCLWPQLGADLPADLVRNGLSISGLHDLEPLRHTPSLQPALRLTPGQVRQASPAGLPAPRVRGRRGQLCSVAGGDESEAFWAQNALIQQAWGRRVVPVAENLPGLNHFSILDALVTPGHRLNQLTLDLLN
ncbi:MAG: alpha/beta hydrolase [Hydrogenophaga sp.]|nr:alpha/beta hydrolase [Hydrogenophaga sp.]